MHRVWSFVLVLGHMERLLTVSQVTDGKNLLQATKTAQPILSKKIKNKRLFVGLRHNWPGGVWA